MNQQSPSPQEALELAEGHLERGDLATAITLYRGIPSSSRSYKKARKALKELQRSNPGAWAQAVLAADINELLHLHEVGPASQVMSRARQLAKSHSNQPLPHNVMGTVYMKRKQYGEAAKCFTKALDLAPEFLDARNNLGAACSALEDFPKAINCYRAVITQRPNDAETHCNLGNALRLNGQLEAAYSSYESAIRLNPAEAKPLIGQAQVLIGLRQPASAIELLQKAIEIDPGDPIPHRLCGAAHKALGQWDQALEYFGYALERDPEDDPTHYQSGLVYLQQDNKPAALSALQKAAAIDPDNPSYQNFIAVASGAVPDKALGLDIAGLFDGYASNFDEHLVSQLGYNAPRQLRQLLEAAQEPGRSFNRAIDLGCGTGLCGEAFKDRCTHLIGVDLSSNMLSRARAKDVYSHLIQDDVVSALNHQDSNFDLFLCADTFIYLGELTAVFDAMARHAQDNALLLFSTEISEGNDLELRPSERYAHGPGYIRSVAAAAGFDILQSEETNLRKELSDWIRGELYLMQYRG